MAERAVKRPGPEHPITLTPSAARIVVKVAGRVVADTLDALTMRETSHAPVHYIPRKDVKMALLERTDHTSYCAYKGDCNYFSIPSGGARSTNAVWTYEAPFADVGAIKEYVAFYPDRVDVIEEAPL